MSLSLMKRAFERSEGGTKKKQSNEKKRKRNIKQKNIDEFSDLFEGKIDKQNSHLLKDKHKYEEENNLERNLKILERIAAIDTKNSKLHEKVMEHEARLKRRVGSEDEDAKKKKKKEKSVFSDKDFEDFKKSYAPNLKKKNLAF